MTFHVFDEEKSAFSKMVGLAAADLSEAMSAGKGGRKNFVGQGSGANSRPARVCRRLMNPQSLGGEQAWGADRSGWIPLLRWCNKIPIAALSANVISNPNHSMKKIAACVFLAVASATSFAGQMPSAKAIDPQALASLRRMSAKLASAKAFTYTSRSTLEVRAKSGQFIALFSVADVALKRPDRLRARFSGDAPHFDFFYDGATAAAYAPASRVYSSIKAPPTVDALLPGLERETGIRLVFAGLLFSDPYAALTSDVRAATFLGESVADGVPCEHSAFRAKGVDWEIWIESGKRALPRRLAVTFAGSRPVIVDFLRWDFHPALRPGYFAFNPPSGATKIPFASLFKP